MHCQSVNLILIQGEELRISNLLVGWIKIMDDGLGVIIPAAVLAYLFLWSLNGCESDLQKNNQTLSIHEGFDQVVGNNHQTTAERGPCSQIGGLLLTILGSFNGVHHFQSELLHTGFLWNCFSHGFVQQPRNPERKSEILVWDTSMAANRWSLVKPLSSQAVKFHLGSGWWF